jgi:uncharacterized protein DUF6544
VAESSSAHAQRQLALIPAAGVFTDGELDGLPTPVRRYLQTAIAPGTPLARAAQLRMRGKIKLGRWLPFRAGEILAPHRGFRWNARVAGGLISGFDSYLAGRGQMRWKLLGLIPVMRTEGPDVTRSAAARAAGEAGWVPTSLLPRFGVRWSATDDHHIAARYRIDDVDIDLRVVLDDDARPVSWAFDRWGDPTNTGSWGWHPFGAAVGGYVTFDGVTVPGTGLAGWFFGTQRWSEGVFFRYTLTDLGLVTAPTGVEGR